MKISLVANTSQFRGVHRGYESGNKPNSIGSQPQSLEKESNAEWEILTTVMCGIENALPELKSKLDVALQPPSTTTPIRNPIHFYHKLKNTWTLHSHLPQNKNWNVDSYEILMPLISNMEELIVLFETIPNAVTKASMLFFMRKEVSPTWEANLGGGCFSFKIPSKNACSIWTKICYLAAGETLFQTPHHSAKVCGVTITSKMGSFNIIKIWMSDLAIQDPELLTPIDGLSLSGVLFKAHAPEF